MSKLFYVIGASGSGKDSVMNYAKLKLNGSKQVIFAHRYITRLPDATNENHIYLTNYEFRARLKANLFAMSWSSHDNFYGIGKEINYWMYQGFTVVVNGSREYLPEAIKKYDIKIQPVLIETSPEVLFHRLKERGRETLKQIQKRMERNKSIFLEHDDIVRISNDGSLDEAGNELFNILTHAPKVNSIINL